MQVLFLLLILLFSCESGEKRELTLFSGIAMTVPYKIIIGKELSFFEKRRVESIINDTFNDVDRIYNDWNPNSEVSKLNQLKSGERKNVSPELIEFLHEIGSLVTITEGRFDPTIYPMQKLWLEKLNKGQSPSASEIQELLPAIGWNKIHLSKEGIFWKDHDATSLDLGGVAKGYAVDLLADRLSVAGFRNIYVEWGGEIFAKGKHPEGRPWRVFISRLGDNNPQNALATIDLKDQGIATSGNYHQNWTVYVDSKPIKYTHIINPKTGYPLEITEGTISSASVLAPTCMFADAMATSLMFPSENLNWIKNIPEIAYWVD